MSVTRSAAPGVMAVFTGTDIDVGPMPPVLPRFDPALSLPLLAREVVRYVGEPVAVVVADTPALAADAAELVVVELDAPPGAARPCSSISTTTSPRRTRSATTPKACSTAATWSSPSR